MNTRIKRIFCAALVLCMLISAMPLQASAAGYYSESDLSGIQAGILSDSQHAAYVNAMMKYHILSSTDNYRVARNLQDGKSIVFFFDGCSDNVNHATYSDYNKYHLSAYCAVVQEVGGVLKIVYESENCSTIPDNPRNPSLNDGTPVPTVLDGVYNITSKNHLGRYAALHIADNSGTVPVIRCTSSTSQVSTSSAINIHARSQFGSAPTNGISSTSYSSTGCFNVGMANDSWSEYNRFIAATLGISKAVVTTPYASGSWTKCTEGIDKGLVIVDRSQYKEQLRQIYGGDNNNTASSLVQKITSYTDSLNVEIPDTPGGGEPEVQRTADSRYSSFLPIHAYPLSTGSIPVYNASGAVLSNRFITGSTDLCIILEIYTDQWCYVSYPSSAESDGYNEAYVPLSTFISSASPTAWTSPKYFDAFRRSDLSTSLGSIDSGDKCLVVSSSGNLKQVIYPVSNAGYFKMGWIKQVDDPGPSDFPTPIRGYNYSADTKTTVYETVADLGGTSFGKIFVDDYCTINAVNRSGNWVNVTYPTSGEDKTGYVYLDQFFPALNGIGNIYTTRVSADTPAYRKADMATSIGTVYPSDTITVVGKSGNLYQVLYPITVGSDAGKYKLGWIYGDAIAKNLTGITVTTKPSKTTYLEGESFSTSGMVVTATYDDGSSAAVTGYTCSGYSSTPGAKTVTISYTHNGVTKTTAIDVTVSTKSPSSLSVTTKPSKLTYFVGEEFSTAGMVVKASYNNGTSATVTNYSISYDFSSAGQKTVTLSYQYNGKTVSTTLTVTVQKATLNAIAVDTQPTKTTYNVGDTLDSAGLILAASYSDGTTQMISSGFTCSPTSLDTAGTQTVTVSYGGKTATFDVTVEELTITEVEIATLPDKTTYFVGESIDDTGLTLKLTYSDGSQKTVSDGFVCMYMGGIMSTPGTKTISVIYMGAGKGTSFDIEVRERPKATFRVADAAGAPGETVRVAISLSSNSGMIAARLKIAYPEVLTLTKVEDGGILGKYVFGNDLSANPYIVTWENGLSSSNFTATGDLVYLTFQISDDAAEGSHDITLSCDPEEIYDLELNNVSCTMVPGSVEVTKPAECPHSYTAGVTAPTCTDQGFTTYTCSLCGDSHTADYVDALGHDEVIDAAQEATCSETGLTEGSHCGTCGKVLTPQKVIPAADHSYTAKVTKPTCTDQGYTTYTCRTCSDSYTGNYTEAAGHDYITNKFNPTCTESGYTTYSCSRCGNRYIGDRVEALGHDFGDWIVVQEATYEKAGQERRSCFYCSTSETREIPPLSHDYVGAVTAPTCTEQGYTTYTCTECGDSYVSDYTGPLGHDFSDWVIVTAASCTEAGTEQRRCFRCAGKEMQTLPAKGHSFGDDGSCTECGEKDPAVRLWGDANGDGTVDNIDAMLILQYAVGIKLESDLNLSVCDVSGGDGVDNVDAMMILQYAVGLISKFPVE